MTGSVQEKKDRLYVKLRYKDKNKKWTSKWVSTGYTTKGNKKKAEAMIPEIIAKFKYLEYGETGSGSILFADAARQWFETQKGRVENSTLEGDDIYLRVHILPYFEPLKLTLEAVSPKHIRDYYEFKFRNGRADGNGGLNVQSIRKHKRVLNKIFGDALIAEQIKRNPVSGVPMPKQEQDFEAVFLTAGESKRVLLAFKGHELEAMVHLTLYYGLRRSEVLGLRWKAVDFENNTLRIEHTVVKNVTVEYKDSTKTKTSAAAFELLPELKELLLLRQQQQQQNRETFGDAYIESDYIFTWQDGKLYRPDYITRAFQRVLKSNGLRKMRYHDLRHSTASLLYDNNWEAKDIQEWLRHADIETTMGIYTHISNDRKKMLGKNLSSILTEKT